MIKKIRYLKKIPTCLFRCHVSAFIFIQILIILGYNYQFLKRKVSCTVKTDNVDENIKKIENLAKNLEYLCKLDYMNKKMVKDLDKLYSLVINLRNTHYLSGEYLCPCFPDLSKYEDKRK